MSEPHVTVRQGWSGIPLTRATRLQTLYRRYPVGDTAVSGMSGQIQHLSRMRAHTGAHTRTSGVLPICPDIPDIVVSVSGMVAGLSGGGSE